MGPLSRGRGLDASFRALSAGSRLGLFRGGPMVDPHVLEYRISRGRDDSGQAKLLCAGLLSATGETSPGQPVARAVSRHDWMVRVDARPAPAPSRRQSDA